MNLSVYKVKNKNSLFFTPVHVFPSPFDIFAPYNSYTTRATVLSSPSVLGAKPESKLQVWNIIYPGLKGPGSFTSCAEQIK